LSELVESRENVGGPEADPIAVMQANCFLLITGPISELVPQLAVKFAGHSPLDRNVNGYEFALTNLPGVRHLLHGRQADTLLHPHRTFVRNNTRKV
jgi:hypothetical protein